MKKIKNWIFLIYLIALSIFLYFLFSKFSLQEITSYSFIKSTASNLVEFREANLFLTLIIFILFGVLWISILQGFGSPLILVSGFLFGAYIGTIASIIILTCGALLTYIFAKFFFEDLIREKFTNRFKFIENKIKEREFLIIFLLRIIGGTPIQIQNLLPVLFNVKLSVYALASCFGFFPQSYIFSSLGSGLVNQIKKNIEPPSIFEMMKSSEIYGPILVFLILLVLAFFLRRFFFKK